MRPKERENQTARPLSHEHVRYYLHLGRDQLRPVEQAALDAHLVDCADCCRYAGEVVSLQTGLAEAMRVRWKKYSPSPAINEQVQARLQRKIWQRQFWGLTNSIAAAAVTLILVAALGWLAWRIRPLPGLTAGRPTISVPASPQSPAEGAGDWSILPGLATFGDQVKLLGYRLSASSLTPGNTVDTILYWQTRSANYTVFTHILDADNTLVAQTDAPGLESNCSQVSRHSTGLAVTCVPLVLPDPLPAGTYSLQMGVYDKANGHRLAMPDGRETLLLTTLQVSALPAATPLPSLPTPTPSPTATARPIPASCPVTLPNGSTPPGEQPYPSHHGNSQLWTNLLPNGVLVPPENVRPDGKLSYNWWWWRGQAGQLTIKGRRLDDAAAPPLEAEITAGFGDTGFQDSWLIFPSAGCWEVTGKVDQAELTFVVYVVKVDRLE